MGTLKHYETRIWFLRHRCTRKKKNIGYYDSLGWLTVPSFIYFRQYQERMIARGLSDAPKSLVTIKKRYWITIAIFEKR
jgi:hypothetical protein